MKKKNLSLMLISLLTFGVLLPVTSSISALAVSNEYRFGHSGGESFEGGNTVNNPHTGTITTPDGNHHNDNLVHLFNSVENKNLFAEVNTRCGYKIYVDDLNNMNTVTAANFIKKHLQAALGINLPKVEQANNKMFTQEEEAIYIGCLTQFAQSGLTIPVSLGSEGYALMSKGKSIFLMSNSFEGYDLGTIKFLERIVGYVYLRLDTYAYLRTRDNNLIYSYDFNDIEIPDYQYRHAAGYVTSETRYSNGLIESPFIYDNNFNFIHNVYSLLGSYYSSHPEWFDEKTGYRPEDNTPVHSLCYLAHGNAASLDLMVKTAADELIKKIIAHPDKHLITLTQEDTPYYCQCEYCRDSIATYKSPVGSMIQFLNRVEEIVLSYIANDGSYKGNVTRVSTSIIPTNHQIDILFFAYGYTTTAPANKGSDGKYHPIDSSVVCNDHVGLYITNALGKYNASFYDASNEAAVANLDAWASCAKSIYVYSYCMNYRGYTFPFDAFEGVNNNPSFFLQYGAKYIVNTLSWENKYLPGFNEFKKNLHARKMIDVNADYQEFLKNYFIGAYDVAANTMLELYQSQRAHCYSMRDIYYDYNDDSMYMGTTGKERWPITVLNNWQQLIAKALEEIEVLQYTKTELYITVKDAIVLESISARFALLTLHKESFTDEEFLKFAQEFKNDCDYFSFKKFKEHDQFGLVELFYKGWGVL